MLIQGAVKTTCETVFGGAERVFIGVNIDQIDKMAPRGVKAASGAVEMNLLTQRPSEINHIFSSL